MFPPATCLVFSGFVHVVLFVSSTLVDIVLGQHLLHCLNVFEISCTCINYIRVLKLVTTELARSLLSNTYCRMNQHGHWMCFMSTGQKEHKTHAIVDLWSIGLLISSRVRCIGISVIGMPSASGNHHL